MGSFAGSAANPAGAAGGSARRTGSDARPRWAAEEQGRADSLAPSRRRWPTTSCRRSPRAWWLDRRQGRARGGAEGSIDAAVARRGWRRTSASWTRTSGRRSTTKAPAPEEDPVGGRAREGRRWPSARGVPDPASRRALRAAGETSERDRLVGLAAIPVVDTRSAPADAVRTKPWSRRTWRSPPRPFRTAITTASSRRRCSSSTSRCCAGDKLDLDRPSSALDRRVARACAR